MILLLACGGPEGPCYADDDADGVGGRHVACDAATVTVPGDCDDLDPAVGPGFPEVCDGADQDCDEDVDEDPVDGLPFWTDGDGDGFGADEIVTGCAWAGGLALADGDCDDADAGVHPGASEVCDGTDRDCDGHVSGTGSGLSESCPADSCASALAQDPGAADGTYWVTGPAGVVPAWCDQTLDGGGWMLGFLRNTASTGSQGDFGYGDLDVAFLADDPGESAISSTPIMAWRDLESWSWSELRLSAYAGTSPSYRSRPVPRSDLRVPFGSDGYYLYGEGGYYWCGGAASYTDGGEGAVNNPPGATPDCKGHGSLGSGWDFSEADYYNAGLTLCGGDGSYFLSASWGGSWTFYGTPGAAQAIWIR